MGQIYGDRWEVLGTLGEGGQAHTYLVKDLKGQGDTTYVLKRLKNLTRIERFKSEIEAVRLLTHLYIVRLIDFDLDVPKPFLVTEHCSGGSLDKAQPFWQSSTVIALELFQQICEAVAYAHSQKIIHRDLKPANIFLRAPNGPPVVGDFGICHRERDGTRITLTEEAVGPRLFIAPELEDGRLDEISPESDTYSLGKLLYWLLSGGKVFSREKYREPSYDLKGKNDDTLLGLGWNNVYMEHVNRLLDLMIVVDPRQRRSVDNIRILAKHTIRLVRKEFTPVAKGLRQPCTYCGDGYYAEYPATNSTLSNFGLNAVSPSDWRILVCRACGHIQFFRIDKAAHKEWWE